MATELQRIVETRRFSTEEVAVKTRDIYERCLQQSECFDGGNFTVIQSRDVARLFDLYDGNFLDGLLRETLGSTPLHFSLSKRMTQAAGKAVRREQRGREGQVLRTEFEIGVSTTLLFQTFEDEQREIVMSGIHCRDRLEALQRIVEHEMVHLMEMLVWVKSSCAAARFQSIANRLFAHTDYRHQLITPRERALTKYGIRAGDRVTFRFEGRHYEGVVNRITKRATVLVADGQGERYSDGCRYRKFYVPLGMLRTAE